MNLKDIMIKNTVRKNLGKRDLDLFSRHRKQER